MSNTNHFSQAVSVFHNHTLPESVCMLAGYTALIHYYDLKVPLPDRLSAISHKHKRYQQDAWNMFTPRHAPHDTLYGHLTFALKYEGIDLGVLKALFSILETSDIEEIVKQEPTGAYSRRIWFLYEWLLDATLALPDATSGNWVDAVDASLQYTGKNILSKRHHVRNNLPGVRAFCPMILKSEKLEKLIKMNLSQKAERVFSDTRSDILLRAAAFLLLKDSKASYAIEGEAPPETRIERWGHAISEAGNHEISHDEFYRLQQIIISDARFIHLGYRYEGGFVGEHTRSSNMPRPDHISAKQEDIISLMDGLIDADRLLKESDIDPVIAATSIAFGFVFIHPFEDGNGRLHRYLMHHVLSEKKFTSNNIVFPVSAAILENIAEYKTVLESYSRPRLKLINWKPTEKGNVEVLNDTADLYRYFNATKQAEFLYECVQKTVEQTLPNEVKYLNQYDEMKSYIKNNFVMPERLVDLLIKFLIQENGKLSKRAKSKEFSALTADEVKRLEEKYAEVFGESEES